MILLLDDERSFADGREALVARTVAEAIAHTESLTELDELWLDFILAWGEDTTDFLRHLTKRKQAGNPLHVKKFIFHSSAWEARGLIDMLGGQAGLPESDFPDVRVTKLLIGSVD